MKADLDASYAFCSTVARREARNFYYSFLVLPVTQRRSMCALYAFMRHTDDLADEPAETIQKRARLNEWRSALDGTLIGDRSSREWKGWPALADAVRRHNIPHAYLHAVIDGVCMDLEPRRYETFDDLRAYCYRVASVVGLCCLHIWGYRSEGGRAESLAESCGLALQLTNIMRDVQEDAACGRIYLPTEDLDRFGIDPAALFAVGFSQDLRKLLACQAKRAYVYFDESRPLIELVEPAGRPMLRAITGIYRSLLDEIVRRDYDVFTTRISVPRWRKAAIAVRSLAGVGAY